MKLIVEGGPQDIHFVECICREKVRRGQLTLTPAADAVNVPQPIEVEEADSKEVQPEVDSKEVQPEVDSKDALIEEDVKTPKPVKKIKKSE